MRNNFGADHALRDAAYTAAGSHLMDRRYSLMLPDTRHTGYKDGTFERAMREYITERCERFGLDPTPYLGKSNGSG